MSYNGGMNARQWRNRRESAQFDERITWYPRELSPPVDADGLRMDARYAPVLSGPGGAWAKRLDRGDGGELNNTGISLFVTVSHSTFIVRAEALPDGWQDNLPAFVDGRGDAWHVKEIRLQGRRRAVEVIATHVGGAAGRNSGIVGIPARTA